MSSCSQFITSIVKFLRVGLNHSEFYKITKAENQHLCVPVEKYPQTWISATLYLEIMELWRQLKVCVDCLIKISQYSKLSYTLYFNECFILLHLNSWSFIDSNNIQVITLVILLSCHSFCVDLRSFQFQSVCLKEVILYVNFDGRNCNRYSKKLTNIYLSFMHVGIKIKEILVFK